MRRHPLVQVVLLTLALTAIGTVVVLNVPWLPHRASAQAREMDTLFNVLVVASVFVFALVTSILIVAVARFRRRFGDEGDGDPIHGHSGLEAVWTAIPAIIVLGAGIYSGVVLADIERPQPGTETVRITGQQFAWSFDYMDRGIKNAGELHLIKGKNYLFHMRAKDVIHSFWVPEFRLKKDAVPGLQTDVRVRPNRLGVYTLVCTELCGLGHSTMRARVIVEEQATFDRWAQAQKKASAASGGSA